MASTALPRLIVALDVDSAAEARQIVAALGPQVGFYKIGLQLLTAEGPALARELVAGGQEVFLDLKLHEIGHSVAAAVRAAGRLGARMVSVHASAGSAILRAAVEAARPFDRLAVVALTVVTSLRDADLAEIGWADGVDAQVRRLAGLAAAAGCQGVVASAHEAEMIKPLLPPGAFIVAPGIQLPGDAPTDQARTASPAVAAQSGATHLVVGRSVTQAQDPQAACAEILRQCREAFAAA